MLDQRRPALGRRAERRDTVSMVEVLSDPGIKMQGDGTISEVES
jgi:hypothetical protein